jgi:hypothetical protein
MISVRTDIRAARVFDITWWLAVAGGTLPDQPTRTDCSKRTYNSTKPAAGAWGTT